jgi:AraC family transcriptional regulator of adaptative response / DNA-3-methyladenine glycosylase II
LLDLDARPDVIDEHLRRDPLLAKSVQHVPGLRLPGAFDTFEVAMRAIVGQRISVKSATTISGRLAHEWGEPIETPLPCLNRLAPTADRIAATPPAQLAALGLPRQRAEALVALASAVLHGEIDLRTAVDPQATVAALTRLPGIGDWTASYIAMRALHWPDAFPQGDLVLCKAAGNVTARELLRTAEAWRPWRGYAALRLWNLVSMAPPGETQ